MFSSHPDTLWRQLCEMPLRHNTVEKERFVRYFQNSATPSSATPNPKAVYVEFLKWYVRNRFNASSSVRATVRDGDDTYIDYRLRINIVADELAEDISATRNRPVPPTIISSSIVPTEAEDGNGSAGLDVDDDSLIRVCTACAHSLPEFVRFEDNS